MQTEEIQIDFPDTELLRDTIDRHNKTYNRQAELIVNDNGNVVLVVDNDYSVLQNPVFELGVTLGYSWMRKNYRIEFTGWSKIESRKLFESKEFPSGAEFEFESPNHVAYKQPLSKLASADSAIERIRHYIHKEDYEKIKNQCQFTKKENWNPDLDFAKNGLWLSYIKTKQFLMVFSTGKNSRTSLFEIHIEGIWAIKDNADEI